MAGYVFVGRTCSYRPPVKFLSCHCLFQPKRNARTSQNQQNLAMQEVSNNFYIVWHLTTAYTNVEPIAARLLPLPSRYQLLLAEMLCGLSYACAWRLATMQMVSGSRVTATSSIIAATRTCMHSRLYMAAYPIASYSIATSAQARQQETKIKMEPMSLTEVPSTPLLALRRLFQAAHQTFTSPHTSLLSASSRQSAHKRKTTSRLLPPTPSKDGRKPRHSDVRYGPYGPPIEPPPEKTIPPSKQQEPEPGEYDWNTILLYSLLTINGAVFLGWQVAENEWKERRDPSYYNTMSKHFLSSEINLKRGRPWTMLTSCISHEGFTHFAVNMISLVFMAPPVIALVGPSTFIGLYFGAGFISSTISIGWNKYVNPWVNRGPKDQTGHSIVREQFSHGASGESDRSTFFLNNLKRSFLLLFPGSIYAVMSVFACLSPTSTFLLFFVLPAPAWVVVPGIVGWDFYSAWFRPGGATDSAGHLGGALAGVLFWRFRLGGARFK